MNLLLDTHVLLWHIAGNPLLTVESSQIIEDPRHAKFLSIEKFTVMSHDRHFTMCGVPMVESVGSAPSLI